MATLFVTSPGQVVAFKDVGTLPLSIFLENWPGFPAIRAAITAVSGATAGNYQFLHTLREFIYVYVFGERVGELSISGMAFSSACGTGGKSGVEQIADYYNKYRISSYGKLINVQIGISGSASLRGFLVDMQQNIMDTQHQLSQFKLTFKTFSPEANR